VVESNKHVIKFSVKLMNVISLKPIFFWLIFVG